MTDDEREQHLDAIRERARIGTVRDALADRAFLLEEVDRLAGLVDNGLSAATWLGTQGLTVSHALDPETYEGDAGAVIEAGVLRGECA